ncbi:MAG: 3-phosphoshikimate 1-carboxyvinyltransferase [Chloroflexi bacterium]|nr:MAG: 3-phosphoshikimate 1-carboxyvinyltransferase [Chloroflexota bacterium]
MDKFIIQPTDRLQGEVHVPGDKSISHRAVLFGGLLADGVSRVRGWLRAGDTLASLNAVRALGVQIDEITPTELLINGTTPQRPNAPLNLVNAGTGIRLLAGLLVGQPFPSVLDGSEQLRRRPMKRVIAPLVQMGANICGENDRAPLTIKPAKLHGIEYTLPVASAQVKSAVLLAGLFAEGQTTVIEPGPARDHTEVMLKAMGADIQVNGQSMTIKPVLPLKPFDMTVPGDFSSAAFLMVAGCIVPKSDIIIRHVNLNATRTGLLDVLQAMGGKISVTETGEEAGEPVGDIHVQASDLRGVEIGGAAVVRMIDEFPALMIAALCADGETVVRDAAELRVKETDRIAVMSAELRKLGATITETPDGFRIIGRQTLKGAVVDGHDDHRVAMSLSIAGLVAEGETTVLDAKCTADSFPGFADVLRVLHARIDVVQ